GLERQRRSEAIAATTLAMLAAYQAVINNGGDPKALDIIGEGALKAFPIKPAVTDDDAKQYVGALGQNVSKAKAKYEAMMRKRAAETGDTSDLPPGAAQAFEQNGGAGGGGSAGATNPALKGKAGAALEGATAAANGDVGGALDAAGKMFPGDTTIGASLQGI